MDRLNWVWVLALLGCLLIACSGAEPEVPVSVEFGSTDDEQARIFIPVYMHYLDRYFAEASDKAEGDQQASALDEAIAEILDASPEGRDFLRTALDAYKSIPEDTKATLFDPDMVEMTRKPTALLDHELIASRLDGASPYPAAPDAPATPSFLEAENKTTFVENTIYRIELTWQDNASHEDGYLIFRALKEEGGKTGATTQIGSVGPNSTTFVDTALSVHESAADLSDQYCYEVVAYTTSPFALSGQPPQQLRSSPSNAACAYWALGWPLGPEPPDLDQDGIPDASDECDGQVGSFPHGCPDIDNDGVPNDRDHCRDDPADPVWWYDKAPRPALEGCPVAYTLRWMGIDVINNNESSFYRDDDLHHNEVDDQCVPPDTPPSVYRGEEPYPIFNWVNGMNPQGAKSVGRARWCCGDRVDSPRPDSTWVSLQRNETWDFEPDGDSCAEEFPNSLNDLRTYGLSVFPGFPGHAAIDGDLGIALATTLMERDYKVTVELEKKGLELSSLVKTGGLAYAAYGSCASGSGPGCLLAVGKLFADVVSSIFGFLSDDGPTEVTLDDPDDYMGTSSWVISRQEALWRTSANGAYAFYLPEMPFPIEVGASYRWWGIPLTMRVRPYFCLVREGILESEMAKLCSPPFGPVSPPAPFVPVLPWPM